jgi:hypothetical protein
MTRSRVLVTSPSAPHRVSESPSINRSRGSRRRSTQAVRLRSRGRSDARKVERGNLTTLTCRCAWIPRPEDGMGYNTISGFIARSLHAMREEAISWEPVESHRNREAYHETPTADSRSSRRGPDHLRPGPGDHTTCALPQVLQGPSSTVSKARAFYRSPAAHDGEWQPGDDAVRAP